MEKTWIRNYEPHVHPKLNYPYKTILDYFEDSLKSFPDNAFTWFFGKKITYSEMDLLSSRFAAALRNAGIMRGDRVALILPNTPHYVIAYLGVMKAGAVLVPVNPLYVEEELQFQLKDAGAKLAVVLDLFAARTARVRMAAGVEKLVTASAGDFLPPALKLLAPLKALFTGPRFKKISGPDIMSFKRFMASGKNKILDRSERSGPDDLAILLYTGGTTGRPKGAALTHRNILANVVQALDWIPDIQYGREIIMTALPLFHSYGMTTCLNLAIGSGGSLILVPKFDTRGVLKLLDKHQATMFPGVPTMYIHINNYPKVEDYNLNRVRICISGAFGLPVEVQEKFEKLTGGRLIEGYGLSECSPITHANTFYGIRKPGCIGMPIQDVEAAVLDLQTHRELQPGEVGELAVRGPQVMNSYWNRDEETKNAFHDGWFLTGDMARVDEDGFFTIVDRKKDMIISGGFNIYPSEVEKVALGHPAVRECVLAGLPDKYLGEKACLFIVPTPTAIVDKKEIIAYCKKHMASFKVPREIRFREELPRNMIGKVLRRVLREEEMKNE